MSTLNWSSLKLKISGCVFFLFLSPAFVAQIRPDSLMNRDSLIQDLYDLKNTIVQSHPNPFGFCTKDEFQSTFNTAIQYLNEDRTLKDFTKTVAQAMGVMKDSHTCIDYEYLQSMQLDGGGCILPIGLMVIDKDIYVYRDRDNLLPLGSKITCINNVPIENLYLEALRYACIEGNAVSAQHRVAEAILPVVASLNLSFGPEIKVDIEESDSSSTREIIFPTYDKNRYKQRAKLLKKLSFSESMKFEEDLDLSTAYLKVGTFSPAESAKYARFIAKSFNAIRMDGIENLVIDLRDNGGGSSSWVEYLYAYIDTNGYNTPSNIIGCNSKIASDRSKAVNTPFSKWLLKHFFKENEDAQSFVKLMNLTDGELDTVYFSQATIQPRKKVFTGNCYLIINGLTASASVDFTHAFRERQRGAIVGESCLGPMTGTWGNPAPYVLPRSKVKVNIATIRYNYDNTFVYDPMPIRPDFEVMTDPRDLASKGDTQLEFIEQLIYKDQLKKLNH